MNILRKYYENELTYLKRQGNRFAKQYPQLAGQLNLALSGGQEPFVACLIQSLAFLTAKINYQIDLNSERSIEQLLQFLYPQFFQPIPAMNIMQYQLHSSANATYILPKYSQSVYQHERHACYFRNVYSVDLYPITIKEIRYDVEMNDFKTAQGDGVKSRLSLSIKRFASAADFQLSTIKRLRFYINLPIELANTLYEMCFNQLHSVIIESADKKNHLAVNVIHPVGYADDEALLPVGEHGFHGHRLFTEFFALPQKFLFFDIDKIGESIHTAMDEFQLHLLFTTFNIELAQGISTEALLLNCSPIINLFERQGEPFYLDDFSHSYPVIADAHTPSEYIEVYQIQSIDVHHADNHTIHCYPMYYAPYHEGHQEQLVYWQYERKQAWEIDKTNMSGYELFVHFSAVDESACQQYMAYPQLLCTNRDLPAHLLRSIDSQYFSFDTAEHELIQAMHCVLPFTPSRYWQKNTRHNHACLAHAMSLHHLTDSAGALEHLKQLISFHQLACDVPFDITQYCVDVTIHPILRRHDHEAKGGFYHGYEWRLSVNDDDYGLCNMYLFGTVLNYYLQHITRINSFIQLRIDGQSSHEVYQWNTHLRRSTI